ncbi:MAG: ATP-binding protein [Oscillospiraceae bacterium]|nr:ATP-binding protein [Oscillospiraceae bacterium]
MGIYLNPGNELFSESVNSNIYVDKSMLIEFTSKVMDTKQKELCISRPRRFGKSMAGQMLTAYYSKDCDSRELFSGLKISQTENFEKHLNKHNVIHLDMQHFLSSYPEMDDMIAGITAELNFDLKKVYRDTELFNEKDLPRVFKDIYADKKEKFIFIIDEWDCIFRVHQDDSKSQEKYLDFLRNLFKDQPYTSLVYMTGILPIKKYGKHSALNIFDEYSMTNQGALAEYTGFTEGEVKELCERFGMSFEETKSWYDGYSVNGISVYNPNSVVTAMTSRIFDNYWTKTETYEALRVYIYRNEEGLRDKIIKMISGERISLNSQKFQNDMCSFESSDDVLTLLVHLGYLTYDFGTKSAWIPNSEIQDEFINSIEDKDFEIVMEAIHDSDKLLKYTLEQNSEKVADMISKVHMQETSILKYNDENSLSCVLALAYYSARDTYSIYREMPGGEGYADLVFIPRAGNSNPAMVIELKWNKTAETALDQIRKKKYTESLKDYKGKVLLAGINYDTKNKKHECVFETDNII